MMGFYLYLHWRIWIQAMINKIFAAIEKLAKLKSFFLRPEDFKRIASIDNCAENETMSSKTFNQLQLSSIVCSRNAEAQESKTKQCSTTFRHELHSAAVKVQKVYKSYRTRRNLADCAIVAEELWWKAIDFASLKRSTITFFNDGKSETALSRWARARVKAAKVGKGLSKNCKAQKLALQHWLEAIDPRHRYGHNMHLYYDVWLESSSTQPFFYWLDVGDGKEVNLEKCPRSKLQQQCVKYLGPIERQTYEVSVDGGKLVYKLYGNDVDTPEDSKWIFVLSTSRTLYIAKKMKGLFHHSSFLSGGATIASGRLIVKEGILKAIWPYSGHYRPTEENFREFINYLNENSINLTDVQTCPVAEDGRPSSPRNTSSMLASQADKRADLAEKLPTEDLSDGEPEEAPIDENEEQHHVDNKMEDTIELSNHQHKWTSGAGPRIRCVRDYPPDLQFKALDHVNLSPRPSPVGTIGPIPSPRPCSLAWQSPRLVNFDKPLH